MKNEVSAREDGLDEADAAYHAREIVDLLRQVLPGGEFQDIRDNFGPENRRINIKEVNSSVDPEGYFLIERFPGTGLVAKISADYIKDQLGIPRRALQVET